MPNDETAKAKQEAVAAKATDAEQALTQVQHIAHEATFAFDEETGRRGPLSEFERRMEAAMTKINEIAETGYPDEDFRRTLEGADCNCGLTAQRCPVHPDNVEIPEAGGMGTSDGLGHVHEEKSGSFNRLNSTSVEYECSECGELYVVRDDEPSLGRFGIICRSQGWTITFDALPHQPFKAPLSMSETEAIADATAKAKAFL